MPDLTTTQHRRVLADWLRTYVPGYQIIWESDLLPTLNQFLQPYGERTLGFNYGKDGRGALPDRYYHILAEQKCLPVANHHDVLGHFLLFGIPRVREVTEPIINTFSNAFFFIEDFYRLLRQNRQQGTPEYRQIEHRFMRFARPSLGLLTYAWNLAQEKLYFNGIDEESGKRIFSLVGAFNTVYNTTLSSRLSKDFASSTASGLGLVSAEEGRSIIIPPSYIRQRMLRPLDNDSSNEIRNLHSEAESRLENYGNLLEELGWKKDPQSSDTSEIAERWKKIINDSIFAEFGSIRLPMRLRWKKFAAAINSDSFFSRFLRADSMLKIAEVQTQIAQIIFKIEAQYFVQASNTSLRRNF